MNVKLKELELFLHESVDSVTAKLNTPMKAEDSEVNLKSLLQVALKNEWETMFLSAQWAINEKSLPLQVNLVRLAGDEAKHFQLIQSFLGEDARVDQTPSALYHHLIKLEDTFKRIVTGPFTREYLAVMRNNLFLEYCEKLNSHETIAIYKVIQEDEKHHHEIGRKLLAPLLKTDGDLSHAKSLITDMLKVVDDMQEMVMIKRRLSHLPGC